MKSFRCLLCRYSVFSGRDLDEDEKEKEMKYMSNYPLKGTLLPV